MAPPMPRTREAVGCRRHAIRPGVIAQLLTGVVLLSACTASPTPTPSQSAGPTPTATPTPAPTPLFSNAADPALIALIPTTVAGRTVKIPAGTDFSITPGDIGQVYGEIGARFKTVQIAYLSRPKLLSLYAMRVDPPFPDTAALEPYLAEAGRYVGIAGLHREPWALKTVVGHVVWMRGADNATLPGTHVYTWAAEGLVFLMIGVDEGQDTAMLAGLPGEAPPTPAPLPSPSGSGSHQPSPSGS